MAWWQRQRGRFVYVFYRLGGKVTSLPRSRTKHLDGLNDVAINIWVADWQRKHERAQLPKSPIITYIERYCRHLSEKGRMPKTVWEHRHALNEFVLPYFLKRLPVLENPNQWPSRSLKLSDYVLGVRKQSPHTCRKVVTALKLFYKFLEEEGVVYAGVPIRVRCPVRTVRHTPLRHVVTPDDLFKFANSASEDFALLAMIGYFFSLRTFELMALRPADFIAGSLAQDLESCRVMKRFGMFDRLAVRIHRQRSADAKFHEPKRASFGHVACFDRVAAEWLVPRLNARRLTELLFPRLPDVNIAKWRCYGMPGVKLKDLRRASIYHLGHYTGLELIALKSHARHRFATTTELYLRRPLEAEAPRGRGLLDLAS